MTDIPNYLSLPLSLVISIAIAVYQQDISELYSRYSERRLLKKREKALLVYRDIYRLKHDNSYYAVKIVKMQLQILVFATIAIITICSSILSRSFEILYVVCKIGVNTNTNCKDIFKSEYVKQLIDVFPTINPEYIGISHFISVTISFIFAELSLIMLLVSSFSMINAVHRLEHFDDFESKLKRRWPDAFSLVESRVDYQVAAKD